MLNELRSVIQQVNSAKDLGTALEVMVREVQQVMGTDVCSVYLYDAEHRTFVFLATEGLNKTSVGKVRLGYGEGLVGLVGQKSELVNLEKAPDHERYRLVKELGEEDFNSFLGVPIMHQRRLLGVVVVQDRQARSYSQDEEAFLVTLSAQLAGVIAHAWATGEVRSLMIPDATPDVGRFIGVPGSSGISMGTACVLFPQVDLASVPDLRTDDIEQELGIFNRALADTRREIEGLGNKLSDRLQPEEMALFNVYLNMLDESALGGEVIELIGEGFSAQTALRRVIESHVETFRSMEDPYLRERAVDIKDLGNRVLARLQRTEEQAGPERYPKHTILVAKELTPAMVAEVPADRLVGLVSARGSGNSHVAILARAMGVPAVMGVVDLQTLLIHQQSVLVDAFDGVVLVNPSAEQESQYRRVMADEAVRVQGLENLKHQPGEMADGHPVNLWVNTALMTDVVRSLEQGAEGVGLYRTEVHFMMNDRFPTEREQVAIYRQHLTACAPRPVTMRTLDIGGDKPLTYFPIEEENPSLGWRGIRFTLDHPEIFLAQVRAMLRAAEGSQSELRILLPMITSLAEVDEAMGLIHKCHEEVLDEGVIVGLPDIGVMIEVPAAVYQVREIASRVDFLSVGSNDLVQYLLAVDRNNPQVADLYQEFHPAVLHALKQIADSSRTLVKSLGICGEMAGRPGAALLLAAMGYDTLSMAASSLPIIKLVLRSFDLDSARSVLDQAMQLEHALQVKQLLDRELSSAGLEYLIRRQGQRGDI